MTSPSEVFFSYSTAAELILSSPKHAWLKKFGGVEKPKPTPAQVEGTIIHSMLLGKDAGSAVVLIPFDNFRKKQAQEQRDEALSQGLTPMTIKQMDSLTTAANEIRANMEAQGISLNGESEVPIEWEERTRDGRMVKCRARLDHAKGPKIIDLKSVSDASPDFISRQIYTLGYDIQHAAYTSGYRKVHPELAGREQFVFVFFELSAPYSVTVATLSGEYRHIGAGRWMRALDTWSECLATGIWPHYATGPVEVSPPVWAIKREDEAFDAEVRS